MNECDPRIHFVLNCGAKVAWIIKEIDCWTKIMFLQSCPAVSVYQESNLENSLNNAARNFVNDNVHVDGNNLSISKLFLWYGNDFGKDNKEIIRYLH